MGDRSKTFDVGTLKVTMFSYHPITDDDGAACEGLLKATALEGTRLAVVAGNAAALNQAVSIVRSTDEQIWPSWLVDAMADAVTSKPAPSRRGRTGNERAARRARLIDAARGDFVDRMIANGLSKRQAYRRAHECLGGDAAGSPNVMEQSYRRFVKHVQAAPHDYFPFVWFPFRVPNKLA